MSAISEQDPHRRKTYTSFEGRRTPFGSSLRSRGINRFSHTTGSTSEPGRVITKAERQRRLAEHKEHSKSPSPEALASSTATFAETGAKILAWLRGHLIGSDEGDPEILPEINYDLEGNLIPDAVLPAAYYHGRSPGRRQVLLRGLIVFVILFILVISPLYLVVEYFIDGISVEAACTPTTIYVPVTQISTITSTLSAQPSSASASDNETAIPTTSYSTIHSTSTLYSTVTVTTVPPGYPTASYVMTVTQTQTVSPLSTPPTIVSTAGSTGSSTPTVTAPAYTSTTFNFLGSPLTITSTSTFYSTVQVSYAPSSRPAYGGYGPSGWNASSTAIAGPTAGSAAPTSAIEVTSTVTATYYLGTDSSTTRTGTTHITTTIIVHGTSMVTLSSFSTSFPYPATSATITSSSLTSESTSKASSSLSSISLVPGTGITTLSIAPTSSIYSNTSTSASTLAPTLFTISSHEVGPATPSASSSTLSTNPFANTTSSLESFSTLGTILSSLFPKSTSTSQADSISSTTKAIIVPITTTLPFGSLTTLLKSTSTTIGLLGTNTQTVSSYFVWNGTTTYANGPTATSTLNLSTTLGTIPTVVTSSVLSASSSPSPAGPVTNSAAQPSLSIPVYGSSAALSALSSELSGLTTSTQSSLTIVPTSIMPNASASSSRSSTTASTSSISTSTTSPVHITSSTSSTSTFAPNPTSPGIFSSGGTTALSAHGSSSLNSSLGATNSIVSGQSTSSSLSTFATASVTTSSSPSASGAMSTSQSTLQGYSQPAAVSSITTQSSPSNAFAPSSATATPSSCGESGPFTMTFDDLPTFTPNNLNQTDITQAPPVPNPYHHLTFTNGYVYAPQPNEPYLPASSPHLAVFLANGSGMRTGPGAGSATPGEIADGPYQSMSAFWFNALSAFVGCDNSGPSECTMVLTGYTWSQEAGHEIATYTQNTTVAPCPSLQGCAMQSISFPESFRQLSGLQMRAFVGQQERMFFLDNLALAWSNDTCAAGMERLQHQ